MCATAPFFRRAAESGSIDVCEVDEGIVLTMFKRRAKGWISFPGRAVSGTSLPDMNTGSESDRGPLTGKPVLAVPAVRPDVTLNPRGLQADPLRERAASGQRVLATCSWPSASSACIVQVERLALGCGDPAAAGE